MRSETAPRTILFLAANPKDSRYRLRLEEEAKRIRRAINRDSLLIETRAAVTADELRKSLSEVKPSIVHFSGHGDIGELSLEDEAGNTYTVAPGDLATLLSIFSDTVECVVLNACYSDIHAQAISTHMPYVLGMTTEILDNAAIAFAEAFYCSLGDGHPYEKAYDIALSDLKLKKMADDFGAVFHILRKTQILAPIGGSTVSSGKCVVSGLMGTVPQAHLYAATRRGDRYWPSPELRIDADGTWTATINVGQEAPDAIISLLSVDDRTAEFVEFYRARAKSLGYSGIVLSKINIVGIVDSITVAVDLMPLRNRLVGSYSLVRSTGEATGEIVDIVLAGEWAIEMISTFKGDRRWRSVIMIDGGNPNVGKGVYTYQDGTQGHHHIAFDPSTRIIAVDGYNLAGDRRWSKPYTLRPIALQK